jgi:hypothetical protein
MENFPEWVDFLKQVDEIKKDLSNFLIDARIKMNNKSIDELPFKKLSKPLSIISKNIYDNSNGSEEDKYIKVLTFLEKINQQGLTNYVFITSQLNKILEKTDLNKIKSNESLLKHIQELLIDGSNIDRSIIIKKEIQEINNNLTNIKIVTDTPILNGVLDFPIYSKLISNIIENSHPRFSVGIFGGWGTGKTTLMTMIKNKLEYVENISFNSEQNKLKNFIKDTYKIDFSDNAKFEKQDDNKLVLEDTKEDVLIDSKGTWSNKQGNKLTIHVMDDKAIININDNIVQELQAKKEKDDLKIYLTDKKILTVWFDAWRYEQEENLPVIALIRSISLAVDDFILSQQPKEITYWEAIKNSLFRSAIALISSSKITYGIKDIVSVETDFKHMLESFKGDGTLIDDKNILYFQADGYFQRALTKLREKDQRYRIIVFVDDLDRCTPEKALKILESIKSFFDMEGIIFIIALNYNGINSIIKEKYGNNPNISGFDYMEKIVQLPFHIPEWTDNDINKFIDSIIKNDVNESIFENEIRLNKNLIVHAVEGNPRQVKRFINDVILARFVFKKPVDNLIAVEALKFRQEWNKFLEFIVPDDRREQFFIAYKKLKQDSHVLERWKEEILKSYPLFFDENDPLRRFLDAGGADKLNSIKNMEEYRRALESVSKWSIIKEAISKSLDILIKNLPNSLDLLSDIGLSGQNLDEKKDVWEKIKKKNVKLETEKK